MKIIPTFSAKKKAFIPLFIFFLLFFNNGLLAQTTGEDNGEKTEVPPAKVKYKVKRNLFRYNNIISLYPFQSIINYMTLGYELKTGEKTAFKTIAGYAEKEKSILDMNNITNYSAFRVEMQFKYFINKKAEVFNGIYIAPFALFKSCKFEYDAEKSIYDPITGSTSYYTEHSHDKASVVHLGFILGYHIKAGESFTIDMFAGEGLMSASGNHEFGSRIFDTYANEIRMRAGLSVGFGF